MKATSRPVGDSRRGPYPRTSPGPLVEALLGPALPGAACRGAAPEFDLDVHGEPEPVRVERHARAVAICAGCPARTACADALASAPRGVIGIWAGEIRGLGGRPRRAAS